jgi:hypothetical protein
MYAENTKLWHKLTTENLRVRREEGDRMAISAELSSEEYVEVRVRVPEGDASYYFRAAVEGRTGKLPTSFFPAGHIPLVLVSIVASAASGFWFLSE